MLSVSVDNRVIGRCYLFLYVLCVPVLACCYCAVFCYCPKALLLFLVGVLAPWSCSVLIVRVLVLSLLAVLVRVICSCYESCSCTLL